MLLADSQLWHMVILSYCFALFAIFTISPSEFSRNGSKDGNSACTEMLQKFAADFYRKYLQKKYQQ